MSPKKRSSKPARSRSFRTNTKKQKPLRLMHLNIHLAIAGLSIIALTTLSLLDHTRFATLTGQAGGVHQQIGIEFSGRADIGLLFVRKGEAGYISIENRGAADVHLSLPQSWRRGEVKNTTLADVTVDVPQFGFVRWKLPAQATMNMLSTSVPDTLSFISPNSGHAAVSVGSVDLKDEKHGKDIVLFTKQSSRVELW